MAKIRNRENPNTKNYYKRGEKDSGKQKFAGSPSAYRDYLKGRDTAREPTNNTRQTASLLEKTDIRN